jgi:hypothetical protein
MSSMPRELALRGACYGVGEVFCYYHLGTLLLLLGEKTGSCLEEAYFSFFVFIFGVDGFCLDGASRCL